MLSPSATMTMTIERADIGSGHHWDLREYDASAVIVTTKSHCPAVVANRQGQAVACRSSQPSFGRVQEWTHSPYRRQQQTRLLSVPVAKRTQPLGL